MAVPKGYIEVKRGICKRGDYVVSRDGGYEAYANGMVGEKIPICCARVYRRPLKAKVGRKTATNTPKAKLPRRSKRA